MEENNSNHIYEALKNNDKIINKLSNFDHEHLNYYQGRCLYNKAAYKLGLNLVESKNIPEEEIKKYLKECFDICPSLIEYALEDKDFKSIKDFEWFQKLTNINYIDNFLEETKSNSLELNNRIIEKSRNT